MIDILVPVLGRPQNVGPLIESVDWATVIDYSLVFICTVGDTEQIDACKKTGGRILTVEGGFAEYPRKMNYAFTKTDREFVFMGADDIFFTPGWDTVALALAEVTEAGVIGTNDCSNPSVIAGDFSTHALVRRSYVDEQGGCMDGPGILCHEGYDHNYTDVELAYVAKFRHQWAFAAMSRVCHVHPGFLERKRDDTYKKGFRQFRRDRQKFLKRQKHFTVRSR